MANFNTHVSVALGASSLAAAVAVNGGLFDAAESPWYVSLGVTGGLLPDIDSDHSRPVKHLFTALGLGLAMLVWHMLEAGVGQRCLMGGALAAFLLMRYPALYFFQKMTVHRGIFHSLLAGIFFALILVCMEYYLLSASVLGAWLSGVFLLFGFLVHLCLDEIFSVDLANGRIKRSFGTALKAYGYQNIPGSILLFCMTTGLLAIAPSSLPLCKAFRVIDWADAIELGPQFRHELKGVLG